MAGVKAKSTSIKLPGVALILISSFLKVEMFSLLGQLFTESVYRSIFDRALWSDKMGTGISSFCWEIDFDEILLDRENNIETF